MTNDGFIQWNGGVMPVSGDTHVSVRLRGGDLIPMKALLLDWRHVGSLSDIVAYKILEKITPEDFGAVADPKGHPNAAILMEIAKEAAVNPEYWKEFEYTTIGISWGEINSESCLLSCIINDVKLRRKPRTIRIGKYNVPEPSEIRIKHFDNSSSVLIDFDNVGNARSMLKALQELLGKK